MPRQEQTQTDHTSTTDGGGACRERAPVDRVMPAHDLRHKVNPLEPRPEMSSPVGTQDQQVVLLSQHWQVKPGNGDAGEAWAQAAQVYRKPEPGRAEAPM